MLTPLFQPDGPLSRPALDRRVPITTMPAMGWSLLLLNLALLLIVTPIRCGGRQLALAGPVDMPPWAWYVAAATAGVCGAAGLLTCRAGLRRPAARRAWLEIALVTTTLPAWAWLAAPARWRTWQALDLAVLAGWFAVVCLLLVRDRAELRRALATLRRARIPAWLAGFTAGGMAIALAVGLLTGSDIRWERVTVSALTYPLYALVQLAAYLVLIVPRLRRMGHGPAAKAAIAAGLFALVHWPNGFAMAATALGMAAWAAAWQRRVNLLWIAVSMGLLATAVTQLLPMTLTHNMRVGPMYVERALQWHLLGPPARR